MSEAASEDCAWVIIRVPQAPAELRVWLDDLETLLRVNSLLEISRWETLAVDRGHLRGRNLSNGRQIDVEFEWQGSADRVVIVYRSGLKRTTTLAVEPSPEGGAALRITDDYSDWSEAERKARLDEVDRSLTQWGHDLHRFFHVWQRWGWLPPWRWYTRRVWLRMKPSARRITRFILWLTLAEIVVFLGIVVVFVSERS